MREGLSFITSSRVNRVNLNYIVKRLEACSDKYGGFCDSCPDLEICVKKFDERCSLGETICPFCKEQVPKTKYCSNCGGLLERPKNKLVGVENHTD